MFFSIFVRFFTPSNKRSSIQSIKIDFEDIPSSSTITLKDLVEKLNINYSDYTFAKLTTFINKDSILNHNDNINIFQK
jgi:sulfur carrier protein ThiS